MTVDEAAALIADSRIDGMTWADLGCGDGTFTLALATLLPRGSVIHAMDRDRSVLQQIPSSSAGTSIVTHAGDFTRLPLPFEHLDGLFGQDCRATGRKSPRTPGNNQEQA